MHPSFAPNRSISLPPPAHHAAAVAARQYGLVTWHQATTCGADNALVRRLRRGGHWSKVWPRVYKIHGVFQTENEDQRLHQKVMSAQLALGRDAFAGGETAAPVGHSGIAALER